MVAKACDVIAKNVQCACLLLLFLPVRMLQDTASRTKIVREMLDPVKYDKRIRPGGMDGVATGEYGPVFTLHRHIIIIL